MGKIRVAVAAALLAVAASTTAQAGTFQEYFNTCQQNQAALRDQCRNKGCTDYVDAWCTRTANGQLAADQAWSQQMSQPGPCGHDFSPRQCCRSWYSQIPSMIGACQLNDPIGAKQCERIDRICSESHF